MGKESINNKKSQNDSIFEKNNDFRLNSIDENNKNNCLLLNDNKVEADFIKRSGTIESLDGVESLQRRTFFERTFGRMDEGSMRGSIFSLVCFVMGSGCLSMPYSFNKMALIPGLISVLIGGISSLWSLNLLIITSEIKGIRDYKMLVKEILGKASAKFVDWLITVYQFFLLIGWTVTVYQIIANIDYTFFSKESGSYKDFNDFLSTSPFSFMYMRFAIVFAVGIIIISPLCLIRDLSKLKVLSLLGILLLIYNILILIVLCPTYISHNINNNYKYNFWDITKNGFDSQLLFFPAFCNIFFALNASVGAFPIYNQLKMNNARRINKVFTRAITIITVLLLILGTVGYLTMPENTNILIIFRDTIEKSDKDYFLTIGKILYVFSLIFTIANNFIVYRMTFFSILFNEGEELNNKRNLLITIPSLLIVFIISSLYQQISAYISIIGGYMGVITLYILPVWIYVKSNEFHRYHWKNVISVLIGGLLTIMGYIGGTISLINLIKGIINGNGN